MLPAQSEDGSTPPHPFIYTMVLGVFQAQVSYGRVVLLREDFVHIASATSNAVRIRMYSIFDFIHLSDIIRAVHLIPDFQSGPSNNLLTFPKSIAHDSDEHWDWKHYYVNRFVDRYILMRYLGGIGHYLYTIHNSEGNLDSEQNESENTEAPLEMREEDERNDAESEEERSDAESEDEQSVGNGSNCIAEDQVSDEEESSIDEEVSEIWRWFCGR
ncbi:hypothetical protein B0J17DRAFT_714405 [Rhizoctonia solani]|nr:hypothetical protein B0J17DRAFT_714405 [Rhizoctonia solani]